MLQYILGFIFFLIMMKWNKWLFYNTLLVFIQNSNHDNVEKVKKVSSLEYQLLTSYFVYSVFMKKKTYVLSIHFDFHSSIHSTLDYFVVHNKVYEISQITFQYCCYSFYSMDVELYELQICCLTNF